MKDIFQSLFKSISENHLSVRIGPGVFIIDVFSYFFIFYDFLFRNEEAFKPIYLTNARNYNLSSNAAFLEQNSKILFFSLTELLNPFLRLNVALSRGTNLFGLFFSNEYLVELYDSAMIVALALVGSLSSRI